MYQYVMIIAVITALVGLGAKLFLQKNNNYDQITWREYVIGTMIIAPVISLLLTTAMWELAKHSKIKFNEYWNGWEIEAVEDITICNVNGICRYKYDCNCRQVYDPCASRNSDGDCVVGTKRKCDSCPYYRSESTYIIKTTIGDFVMGNHHASSYDPYNFMVVPPKRIPVGPPIEWTEAANRIATNNPGPVSKRMPYKNYIYASDNTILKEYSPRIEELLANNLLPSPSSTVHNHYVADKVYFVGGAPENYEEWHTYLRRLDAALGMERQGDLHLIVLRNYTGGPDEYIGALKAYWQSTQHFGRDTVAKNAIMVVINTDGNTVLWSRAATGMPHGNTSMTVAMRNEMEGVDFTPQAVIGYVDSAIRTDEDGSLYISTIKTNGVLCSILWDNNTGFVRISMSGDDADDVGGGSRYLMREIEPSGTQKFFIVFFAAPISSAIIWTLLSKTGESRTACYKMGYLRATSPRTKPPWTHDERGRHK